VNGGGAFGGGGPILRSFPPPLHFFIFSFGSAVTRAAREGKLPHGAHVLFNVGTLFSPVEGGGYALDSRAFEDLRVSISSAGLAVGMYLQESHLDAQTARMIVEHVNEHTPSVYSLGLSYSNLPGLCAADISDGCGFPLPRWIRKKVAA
jgi:hypothetical protein